LCILYNITNSWLLSSIGFDFIILWRDSENQELIKGALGRRSRQIQLQLIISKSLMNVKTLNAGNHTTQNKTKPDLVPEVTLTCL